MARITDSGLLLMSNILLTVEWTFEVVAGATLRPAPIPEFRYETPWDSVVCSGG